jgi:predicted NBD/HSP70 family sugar kinase
VLKSIPMAPGPREAKLLAKKHAILVRLFRERQASRTSLAGALDLNASMVGRYVEDLLRRGLVSEDARGGSRRGRLPVAVRLNPGHGCFLGLDFEALRTRAVLSDFAGDVVARREAAFRPGVSPREVVRTIVSVAIALARRAGRRPLLSVGIAAPGQLDFDRGRVVRYPLLPGFEDVPVREAFERRLDAPVFLEENIRALTVGEMLRGAGRGHAHLLCVAVRSGAGVGIVIDGKIHLGVRAAAGELGWTAFPTPAGPRRLTDLVAATGIARAARERLRALPRTARRAALLARGETLSLPEIVRAAEEGDRALASELRTVGERLGLVLANLANLLAPEKIVLAGEVPTSSALVRDALEAVFRRHLYPDLAGEVALADSRLQGYGAAVGAACLGFLRRFPTESAEIRRAIPGVLSP